ncbi:hypothetical protein [Photobacterium lutimaris]|uniref:Uncharacterized protein n=1 Tax=Photobacterium lutimaris TaxID=388278 RepID=A0A2T3ITQ7_9GAMM|nr:hypothetical protein [Photobacterium lutimaris]PSU31721.1 hypothetical protein C9I99_21280 [Photobacterium lutimaris]TDR72639.1 hypothetical protein DFP78_113115 [Photobacterium lutimaris]
MKNLSLTQQLLDRCNRDAAISLSYFAITKEGVEDIMDSIDDVSWYKVEEVFDDCHPGVTALCWDVLFRTPDYTLLPVAVQFLDSVVAYCRLTGLDVPDINVGYNTNECDYGFEDQLIIPLVLQARAVLAAERFQKAMA